MATTGADPLARVQSLGCLSPAEREAIAKRCAWRRYAVGETIISRGDDSTDILWIVSGRARAIDLTPSGREVVYAEIQAGSHVGELAAIDGGTRSADVVALDEALIASLPAEALHELILRHPAVAIELLKHLARVVRLADLRITELSTMGAVHRICRELLRRAAPCPAVGGPAVDPVPTQEALAGLTGTTRETVGRVLAQLAHAKLVRRRGRTLALLDLGRLQGLAGLGDEGADTFAL
jgi:CRP-like cAMP-binding protein